MSKLSSVDRMRHTTYKVLLELSQKLIITNDKHIKLCLKLRFVLSKTFKCPQISPSAPTGQRVVAWYCQYCPAQEIVWSEESVENDGNFFHNLTFSVSLHKN